MGVRFVSVLMGLVMAAGAAAAQPPEGKAGEDVCLSNACSKSPGEIAAPAPAVEPDKPYTGPPGSVFERVAERMDMSSDEIVALLRAQGASDFAELGPGEWLQATVATNPASGFRSVAIVKHGPDPTHTMMLTPGLPRR